MKIHDSSNVSPLGVMPAKGGAKPRLRSMRSMLALESRIVFDGAVQAAIADPLHPATIGPDKSVAGLRPGAEVVLPDEKGSGRVAKTAISEHVVSRLAQITSAPATPALTLDATSDTGFSSSDGITNVTRPVITGTADDGSTITLYGTDGTTVLGTAVAAYGMWSITTTPLNDGVHLLTAKATDATGNVSATSSALSVTIDTFVAAPSTPVLDSSGDSGPSNPDGVTNNNSPTFTGTAEADSTVVLYDNTGYPLSAAIATDGVWTITPLDLPDGTYVLTVRATDVAGNVSAASGAIRITIDTGAPATPAAPVLEGASDSGASNSDGITHVANPIVTGAASSGSTITLYDSDGVTVLGSTVAADGAWRITSGTLGEGDHTLTVKVTNLVGNTSAVSSGLAITIDTGTPATPVLTLDAASDTGWSGSDGITSVNQPVFTGTAESGSTVTLYDSDGTTVLGSTVATDGTWRIASSVLASGVHALSAKATDAAGNVSAASDVLSVTVDTGAPAAPAAVTLDSTSDSGSSNSDGITRVTTPVITGVAEIGSTVTMYDTDGTTVLGSTIATDGTWRITSSTLTDGVHSLSVKATDTAGNTSATSAGLAIVVDTKAPAIPSASLPGSTAESVRPTITGHAEAGSTVTLYDTDGTTVLGTTVATDDMWSITSTTLSDGIHTLSVTATDDAGNSSAVSAALSVNVDKAPVAPAAPELSTASDTGSSNSDRVTRIATPVITGTAASGNTVTLYDTDGIGVLGTTVAADGVWRITSRALDDGVHTLSVKATDTSGRTSPASAVLAVTIDTTAPAAAGMPRSNDDGTTSFSSTRLLFGDAEAGSTVTLRDGDQVIGTVRADANGRWTFTAQLTMDPHQITASATDAAGNTGPTSQALALNPQRSVLDLNYQYQVITQLGTLPSSAPAIANSTVITGSAFGQQIISAGAGNPGVSPLGTVIADAMGEGRTVLDTQYGGSQIVIGTSSLLTSTVNNSAVVNNVAGLSQAAIGPNIGTGVATSANVVSAAGSGALVIAAADGSAVSAGSDTSPRTVIGGGSSASSGSSVTLASGANMQFGAGVTYLVAQDGGSSSVIATATQNAGSGDVVTLKAGGSSLQFTPGTSYVIVDNGASVFVAPTSPASNTLVYSQDIGNVPLSATSLSFKVPLDATLGSPGGDAPKITARQADGTSLPAWLKFDPETLTFSGYPPNGASSLSLAIDVVQADANGNTAVVHFTIKASEAAKPLSSLPGSHLLMALGPHKHATETTAPSARATDDGDAVHADSASDSDAAGLLAEILAALRDLTHTSDTPHAGGAMSEQLARESQRFAHDADATLQHLAQL